MKILFAGDICFKDFAKMASVKEPCDIYGEIKPVFDKADFRMINLECPLYEGDSAPILKSGPNIKADPKFVKHLTYLGIDLAGLANNHTGDYGEKPIFQTVNLLNQNNIASIGAGKNIEEAYKSHIFEKDGMKVSVIAACENEFGIASSSGAGAAGFNLYRIKNRICEEKKNADKVVVFFHGGNETNPFPSPLKTENYKMFVDFGADAVIAMHTHCPQGYEIYKNKPIIYSLGNFYFPMLDYTSRDKYNTWFYGYVITLEFSKDNVDFELQPYRFGTVNEPMNLLEGQQKEEFMKYISEISSPISEPAEIERLFSIWSAVYGEAYEFSMNYTPEMKQDNVAAVTDFKNLFGCDAHNEMITRFTNLCYTNTFAENKEKIGEIRKYQTLKGFID